MAAKTRIARLLKHYESCKITKEELRKLLESRVLGRVTGIVGPFVLRYHKDKLIISERALFYHKSMSAASIKGRNNFSTKVRFAKFLKNIDILKKVWNKAEGENGRAWNKLIKYNNIRGTHPTVNNIITPLKHHFEIDQICSFDENLHLIMTKDSNLLPKDKIVIVLVPFDPIKKGDAYFEMISFTDKKPMLIKDQQDICRRYRKYVLYTAVIRENNGNLEWSNTAASEGYFKSEEIKCGEDLVLSWLFFVQDNLRTADYESVKKIHTVSQYHMRL